MEFEKLKKVIAEVLSVDPDEITMETTFADDLGADSLDVFQIIMGLEEEFDIVNSFEEDCMFPTKYIVRSLSDVEYVKKIINKIKK